MINDGRSTRKIKSGTAMAKAAFKKRKVFHKQTVLNLRKKLVNCYDWNTVLKLWTLKKVDQKNLETFQMWCWRRMDKISWTENVRSKALQSGKKERNILYTIQRRKTNLIGYILYRNCLLKHIMERKTEVRIDVVDRRGRRHEQLLDDLKETRRYWKLKTEALYCTLLRTQLGRGYGPVVRQTI
jgi:hypothetical protein